MSSTLVTALGNPLAVASLAPGGTMTYVRRLYVGARDDVRSVADEIIPALSARLGFATGRLAGDVDAADTSDVAASIVLTRLGRCGGDASRPCKAAADCAGGPACADPVPIAGFGPGGAVTHVRTDATGAFGDVVVPQGDYELVVASAERDDVTVRPVVVGAGTTTVTTPPLSARGGLAFVVREKRRGRPTIPARLTVKGVAPTVDPRFHKDLSAMLGGSDVQPETFGGTQAGTAGHAAGQGNVIYTATGSGTIQLRPGTYDVWASRGMEYGVQKRRVTVRSGTAATARFALKRVIRTHDAISADFHVHSGRSLDSSAPLRDRVASFAGEGVEVMIATDHDKHVDYAPLVAELGLGARIRSIPGVEVTGSVPNPPAFPNAIGHINGWPMAVAADEPRDGAIADEYVAPNWVFKRLRDRGAEVVQYNHPRAGVSGLTSIGIFNSIGCSRCANAIDTACTVDADCPTGADQECTCVGFQPDRLLSEAPNDVLLDTGVLGPGSPASPAGIRNVDFDVMEIANGARDGDFPAWRQVRADWFALLNQGVVRPGTGVSDSHRITVEHAGWARTFVRGAGDDPAALDVSAFDAQVKAGNMLVSAGPWIEASVRAGRARGELGQTVASADGAVRLRLAVRSPAWIPVEEVRVVANGVVVKAFDATSSPRVRPVPRDPQSQGGTTRLQATVPLTLARDTWIVVEAGAKLPDDPAAAPTPPDVLNVVQPGVVPLAFTNPIFVDVGGDGFTPPGLAVRADRAALPPGRMTGVTRAQRAEAVRRGEFFPLHTFVLPAPGARP
ncbi:MAG: CehA/McbA family metallohydrolase [Candidatus Binatia bacterium]